jgi:cell division protein FtsI (penicillin-binding protein 3)
MDPKVIRGVRVRIFILIVLFVPLFGALLYRAIHLQVWEGSKLSSFARDQYIRNIALPGRRGAIYDRRGAPLAISVDVESIFINPLKFAEMGQTESSKAIKELAKALSLDARRLERTIGASKHFAWVKRQVSSRQASMARALKIPALGFTKEARRFYPQRELAAHVLGFANIDGRGLEGIELAFDDLLKGKPRSIAGLRDARGRSAIVEGAIPSEALEGASITLTIDSTIQYLTEKALNVAVKQNQASSGFAVVLTPATGEILALANVPTFNPNNPVQSSRKALRNHAITDQFEPGSTFKVFTIAGALEKGVITSKSQFFCENGRYAIGRRAIHDHNGYGNLDLGGIIQVSSNIGAAKIAEKLGRENLQSTFRAFGFGEKPGSGLRGEARGSLPFPRASIALATQSFGQGVSASALQIAAAFGAVANGGELMRPYLVVRAIDPDGALIMQQEPEKLRRVISSKNSRLLLDMMRLVVEKEGTATAAWMDEYDVAGKTGTAQKVDFVTGGYSAKKRTASFVGVVPAEAPRLVILVVVDEPTGEVYGGIVAAPAFKEIAQGALAHLGIPPSPSKKNELLAANSKENLASNNANKKSSSKASALKQIPVDGASDGFIEEAQVPLAETEVLVPPVIGLNTRGVVKVLTAAHLVPDLQGKGKVVKQNPVAGTALPKGSSVTVQLEASTNTER